MLSAEIKLNREVRSSTEFNQCSLLWKNLPILFKSRWRDEAGNRSMSGYSLFIKTNINNMISGKDIEISPWH